MLYTKLFSTKFFSASVLVALLMTMPSPWMVALAEDGIPGEPNPETQQPLPGQDGTSGDTSEAGQSGGDGTSGGTTPVTDPNAGTSGAPSSDPAIVNTGDSTSTGDATNQANTNTVTTPASTTTTSSKPLSSYQLKYCAKFSYESKYRPSWCPPRPVTTITTTNDATINADQTTEAGTGANTADGGEGAASITTGNALAVGNAINIANSNIINSSGMLLFMNLLFGEQFDMRNMDLSYFFGGGASSTQNGCSLTGCGGDLTINADNTAVVTNTLVVRADSGGNTCTGQAGCDITTGNAYAAGNAVNLVNTNIIDSNYLLVTMNSFGDLGNDLILPGADFFTKLLAQNGGGGVSGSGGLSVDANNTATVGDSTNAGATSGDNTATTGDGNTAIGTGNAVSSATSFNQVNTNLVGGTQIFLLFRVWGDWTGNIQGLPQGMMWEETPFGIVLKNADGTPASTSALKGNCTVKCDPGSTTINANNAAAVTNNVNVFALTGDNEATSASGTASIDTGDAYASANSVNMVNTNLIGQNWIFMIFNIFGNWNGNIAFGHPDLWVGASAETPNPTLPGSEVTYRFTVANKGDSDATNVRLNARFPASALSFAGSVPTAEGAMWNLGTIPRGATKEFVYKAIAGTIPQGTSLAVPLEASVTSHESDANTVDNTEHLDLVIQNGVTYSTRGVTQGGYEPKISMVKTANTVSTTTPTAVDYTITVTNDGGDAFDVFLTDTLRGPNNKFVGDQKWDLGKVKSGEVIKITYTVQFGKSIPAGKYTNTARLSGMKSLAIALDEVVATNVVEISHPGAVLGVAKTPQICTPYLLEYVRPGVRNSEFEVKKLQTFLMKNEGAAVTESGQFDASTIAAVKAFQEEHAAEILTPWGISEPTGAVYFTTKKKINELTCDGEGDFNLTNEQITEMNKFKIALPTVKTDTIKKAKVGVKPTPAKNVVQAPAKQVMPVFSEEQTPQPASTTGLLKKQLKSLSSWLISSSF